MILIKASALCHAETYALSVGDPEGDPSITAPLERGDSSLKRHIHLDGDVGNGR